VVDARPRRTPRTGSRTQQRPVHRPGPPSPAARPCTLPEPAPAHVVDRPGRAPGPQDRPRRRRSGGRTGPARARPGSRRSGAGAGHPAPRPSGRAGSCARTWPAGAGRMGSWPLAPRPFSAYTPPAAASHASCPRPALRADQAAPPPGGDRPGARSS
jgi:hypothetical protein